MANAAALADPTSPFRTASAPDPRRVRLPRERGKGSALSDLKIAPIAFHLAYTSRVRL